jgi:thiosulfate reductase cytochrome b subunit
LRGRRAPLAVPALVIGTLVASGTATGISRIALGRILGGVTWAGVLTGMLMSSAAMLGWVRERSGTLRAPMTVHAANNVVSLAFAVVVWLFG